MLCSSWLCIYRIEKIKTKLVPDKGFTWRVLENNYLIFLIEFEGFLDGLAIVN